MAEKKSTATAKKVEPKKESPKSAAKPAAKKVEKKRGTFEMNPKLANPDSILKSYEGLINQLAKVEADQRIKGKPYRIYFVHRKRIEVMKMNFIKSMR